MVTDVFSYGDESGTTAGSPFTVVAGYVGNQRQWKRVGREWKSVLDCYGISEFHSSEFFHSTSRRNPFHGWSNAKKNDLYSALVQILASRRELHPISCAVNTEDYYEFNIDERRFLTNALISRTGRALTSGAPTRTPYQLAFSSHMWMTAYRVTDEAKVHFVYDTNNVESTYAQMVFEQNKERHGNDPVWSKLDSITFADSHRHAGLQAADLYVYLCRLRLSHGLTPQQESAFQKLSRVPNAGFDRVILNREHMEIGLATLSPTQRHRPEETRTEQSRNLGGSRPAPNQCGR